MSLQLGKCIFHRWLIPPEGKVGTRIRFKTSMPGRYFDQENDKVRTFEATLSDVSTQKQLDVGDERYGFVLDNTHESAEIFRSLGKKYQQEYQRILDEWAHEPAMLAMAKDHFSSLPVFRLTTSAEYIFAEGDRVTVNVPSPTISSIYEPLGDIVELEIIE
jgi:hypothetical protein